MESLSVSQQALQKNRGLDYNSANCNIQELRTTMEPFDSERNPVAFLREHARAIDAFDYDRLNYQYDNLNFHGLSIPELDELLNKRKAEDRVFANFMLHVSRVWSLHGVACFVVMRC